jgi:hypothetical protein
MLQLGRRILALLGTAAVAVFAAVPASAGPVFTFSILDVDTGTSYFVSAEGRPNPDGSFGFGSTAETSDFRGPWSTRINTDPKLELNIMLTNLGSKTQTFVLTVTLPIAPIGPTTLRGGATGDITYTDTSGDGNVTLATLGADPFYSARVDGVSSMDLGHFTANAKGSAGVSDTILGLDWGTPIPSAPFGPAINNMQIRTEFSLTAGDSVQYDELFVVKEGAPVPEPGTLALMGVAIVALAGLRLRA